MKAILALTVAALCLSQINAFSKKKLEVSEDCLWGRESAESCCKNIPEGYSIHLANPKECSSFYVCKNRKPMLWPCLPGQIWSVTEKKCIESSTPDKCDQLASLRMKSRKVSDDCLWGRESAESCCADIPEGDSTHLANPKECSSFYLCKNNKPLLWPCLPGQIWSVPDQLCVDSDTTDKCEQLVTLRSKSCHEVSEDCLWGRESAESCCKDIPEGMSTHLANPKECSSFYVCKNRKPMLWPCLPGQIWSVTEKKCVISSTPEKCDQVTALRMKFRKVSDECLWGIESAESCCKNIPNGDPTHLANQRDCTSFYLCKDNKPILWPCLPEHVWSIKENKCIPSKDTNKCDHMLLD